MFLSDSPELSFVSISISSQFFFHASPLQAEGALGKRSEKWVSFLLWYSQAGLKLAKFANPKTTLMTTFWVIKKENEAIKIVSALWWKIAENVRCIITNKAALEQPLEMTTETCYVYSRCCCSCPLFAFVATWKLVDRTAFRLP